jgi:hypothetical protein
MEFMFDQSLDEGCVSQPVLRLILQTPPANKGFLVKNWHLFCATAPGFVRSNVLRYVPHADDHAETQAENASMHGMNRVRPQNVIMAANCPTLNCSIPRNCDIFFT